MAAREPISVERGSGAPDGAQKPSINQRTTQMEGLALNQNQRTKQKEDKQKRVNQLTTIRK